MSDRLAGRVLGDFRLEALVGRGAMGKVYSATQLSLGRTVAVKVFEEGLFTVDEVRERFVREARIIAALEHPHIVPVYAAGQDGPVHYFAMRYLQGRTFDELLRERLPLRAALRHLADLAGALAYAHERGLVHRDVKPSNVMVVDDAAILTDFGLARAAEATTLTGSGQYVGTPLYFSPEQARMERATPRSDLFALGILLFQAATGRHPFGPGESFEDTIRAVLEADVPKPSAVAPAVPAAVDAVADRALRRDPAERYADGWAMRADLLAALSGA